MKVDPESYQGKEEWYGAWFACPNCQSKNVRDSTNYCDNCGIKLDWSRVKAARQ